MSLSTLSGFRDFVGTPEETETYWDLTEARQRTVKNNAQKRGDVGDGNWDILLISWFYGNAQNKDTIKGAGSGVKLPTVSTMDWEKSVQANPAIVKGLSGLLPNANIGRGEVLLYYLFNFPKDVNWVQQIIKIYGTSKVAGQSLEDFYNETESQSGRSLPVNRKGFGALSQAEKTEVAYQYVTSKQFVGWSAKLTSQGKSVLGYKPKCTENPSKAGGADLIINKIPVEVKSYKSLTQKIKIGRITEQGNYKPLSLFESLFGFYNLFMAFGDDNKEKKKLDTVKGYDLPEAFEVLDKVMNDVLGRLPKDIKEMAVFKSLQKHIDELESIISEFANHPSLKGINTKGPFKGISKEKNRIELSRIIMKGMILHELDRKPGEGGYYMNLTPKGEMQWVIVKYESITDDWKMLSKQSVSEKNLKLSFKDITVE